MCFFSNNSIFIELYPFFSFSVHNLIKDFVYFSSPFHTNPETKRCVSNALQFEAIWRTAFQKKEKEDAYVRYVLFSVSADCRKYRLHQNGRLRQAAVHSAFAGSARRRTDPPFACRHGGRGCRQIPAPPFWPMVFFTTLTNVNFDDASIKRFTDRVRAMRRRLDSPGSERKGTLHRPSLGGRHRHRFPALHASVRLKGHGCLRASRSSSRLS